MAAIDEDQNLSPTGKAEKKREIATEAIAHLEKSKTLASARDSVERQISKWDEQSGLAVKPPSTIAESVQQSEIRAHISAMKDNRVSFVEKHAHDPRVVAAVLGAPAFLSGLTDADINIVKAQIAKRLAPKIAEAKALTVKALEETEAGWRSAIRQIFERGDLKTGHNGGKTA